MSFDITAAIEALGEATSSGFSYAEKSKERQSETQIIKTNKRYIKALDAAEKIILLSYRYYNSFNEKDQKEFQEQLEKFLKHN